MCNKYMDQFSVVQTLLNEWCIMYVLKFLRGFCHFSKKLHIIQDFKSNYTIYVPVKSQQRVPTYHHSVVGYVTDSVWMGIEDQL